MKVNYYLQKFQLSEHIVMLKCIYSDLEEIYCDHSGANYILPPFQEIRRTCISRQTLTIKIEQQNVDYIICNWNCWIRIEKHFLMTQISYKQYLSIKIILDQTKNT
jgi:hypothetical protein